MRKLYLFFAIMLLVPCATAHLAGGTDKSVGGFTIDFGYDPEQVTTAEPATLAFGLVDDLTRLPVEPSNVWIRIAKDDKALFASTFAAQNKQAILLYTFPEGGDYNITTRFMGGEAVLAQTSFNLKVKEVQKKGNYLPLIIAGIVGITLGMLAWKVKKK